VIEIDNITKLYSLGRGRVEALRGVDLKVKKGGFLAVSGSSGSGKTTLMNILGCLDTPTRGRYVLDNEDVSTLDAESLSKIRNEKIGFVFQNFNLLGRLSAVENVEMPLVFRGENNQIRRGKAVKALEEVGLSNRISHRPKELSGGQQQRVAIARAIVTDPSVVLADEPTGNLDRHSGEEILEILLDLNSRGTTIVLITHDPEVAKRASERIILSDGKIVDRY
jgi:putative ABC transport system ATP-binding protein